MAPTSRRGSTRLGVIATVVALALVAMACSSSSNSSGNGATGEAAAGDLLPCPIEALEAADEPVEVVVWHMYVAKTKDTLEALAEQYNASQDKVRVRVESQGNSYDELWNKYQQGASSGDLPGIAILEDTNTQAVVDSGTVLPAQSCIDATDYDTSDLVESVVDYYSVDGALYPGTLNVSAPLLYYNKNHFRAAGLDAERTPETLAEVREFAEKIKASGVVETPVILHLSAWFFETWLTGVGEGIVDNDNGRGERETTQAAFDDPATVELVTWVQQMADDGLLTPLPYRGGTIDHYLALGSQNASMTIETSTAATSIAAFLEGDESVVADADAQADDIDTSVLDIGAGPVPGIEAAGQVQLGGGAWYMTTTNPPEVQAAAWDFITWWNRPETQVIWHLEGSYLPFSKQAATDPEILARWEDDVAGRWLAIAYRELLDGVDPAWPGPLIGPYDEFRDSFQKALEAVTLQGRAPDEAVRGSAEDTTRAIERYNEEV